MSVAVWTRSSKRLLHDDAIAFDHPGRLGDGNWPNEPGRSWAPRSTLSSDLEPCGLSDLVGDQAGTVHRLLKSCCRLAAVAPVTGTALLAYLRFGRQRVLNWGATAEEILSFLPGDELLTDVAIQTTRATTVKAGPEAIWPWLVQMGPKPRAGVYTYDWLERLLGVDVENSDRILPEYQHLEAGQFFPLNARSGNGLTVREVEA